MLARNDERTLSTAEAALTLGITPKALRLYERKGLVRPARSAAGWRAYGPEALARLHQILALKALGLSLQAIGEVLNGQEVDLDGVLALQEQALARRRASAERGLRLVRAARRRLAAGKSLSLEELTTLTKETAMPQDHPDYVNDIQPIIDKHFTQADRERWAKRAGTYDQAAVNAEWMTLIAEAKSLLGSNPSSPQAIDLARRWREMATVKSGADEATIRKISKVYQEAMADPAIAPKLPFGPDVVQFINEAAKFLSPQKTVE